MQSVKSGSHKFERVNHDIVTLFNSSRGVEFGRFNLSFCQMKGGSQELGGLHVQHQLLHLPVGGSTRTSGRSWEGLRQQPSIRNQSAASDYKQLATV